MNELEAHRKVINEIDKRMQDLFVERFNFIEKIANYKKLHGLTVFDEKREKELIDNLLQESIEDKLKAYYLEFIKNILVLSKKYQESIIIKEEN